MMQKTFDFFVPYNRFMNEQGQLEQALPAWSRDQKRLLQAYETMVLIRNFDQKAVALQRTGKMGTYPSILGQEAIGVAIGQSMRKDDVLIPYYRDLPAQYLRGVRLVETLLYWGGDERGSCYQQCPEDLPNCVPIATQMCHAAGVATAFKIRGEKRAAVVTCGDGATSKGDFLESLNVAGVWQLPMVIVVNNNQWAISTPRKVQSASQTIAQKAIGAGISGIQVDGNDYFAITDAVQNALEKAHAGKGATLIEALSYRLGDHTTADDATRYRSKEELKAGWEREPVQRLRQYLVTQNLWSEDKEKALQAKSADIIETVVQEYFNTPPEPPESMFDHLFADMPATLVEQRIEAKSLAGYTDNQPGSHH
ncbi:pyruvate dehydrogenase (acetyl-transferring) E1 component subunit alpha [Hahella sp. CCB-MM4]|nr:pyruvate dehydrogenase (acetyl-transferring) E1 component subunit alpha [Hahella sp. CCB-MM4]